MGNYSFYRLIQVDKTKVGETDANFAVLLNLTAAGSGVISDLKTIANGGDIQHTASGGAGGGLTVPADLTFRTTADLSQAGAKLDFEIEFYDAATGALVAWVQSGVDTAADIDFYMVYGNADVVTSQENVTGVWDSGFKAIWHFPETSGQHYDSTANNHDTSAVSVTAQGTASGIADGCDDFDSVDDYLTIPSHSDFDFQADFTIEVWLNLDTYGGTWESAVLDRDNNTIRCYRYVVAGPTDSANVGKQRWLYVPAAGTSVYSSTAVGQAQHVYCVLTFVNSPAAYKFYRNGVADGSGSTDITPGSGTCNLTIAKSGIGLLPLDGRVDELRVSNVARTANYVTTAFNNQSSPSTFYSVGAEQEEALSFTADAILQKTLSSSLTADAYLVIIYSLTADAVLTGTPSSSIVADAILEKTTSSSITADARLLRTVSDTITTDSVLKGTRTDSFIANAILKKIQSSSFTADSTLVKVFSDTFTANAILKETQPDSFTADAYLVGQAVSPKQHLFTKAGPIYLPVFPLQPVTVLVTTNHAADYRSVILCDASSGSLVVTLPDATDNTNKIYTIKKTDVSANLVLIDGADAETIEGETTQTLSSQYDMLTAICDGSAWYKI